jgi:hypothetical protein
VTESVEFNIYTIKRMHTLLFHDLKSVPKYPDSKLEMYLWSKIALSIWDLQYWTSVYSLGNRGIIDKEYFKMYSWDQRSVYGNNGELAAQSIFINIILPYLGDYLSE